MQRLEPRCSKCGGKLDQPLPPELLDPRLHADGRVMRCASCGRAERIDLEGREKT